jgi:hypothetical protein
MRSLLLALAAPAISDLGQSDSLEYGFAKIVGQIIPINLGLNKASRFAESGKQGRV